MGWKVTKVKCPQALGAKCQGGKWVPPRRGQCCTVCQKTTTTTTPAVCPEVAVNWKSSSWKAPYDNGAACFRSRRGWGARYNCGNVMRYCNNRRWRGDVDTCCPGMCEADANPSVFIPELGKVTRDGVGPLGRGKPTLGSAAGQPALLFWNKQATATVKWQNPVTEMTVLYSDADFNERITFSTNGGGSTFAVTRLGPTDSWTPPNVLSGSGNDRNDDPNDYSTIVINNEAGFTELRMAHGFIRPTGVNGILQLKARPKRGSVFGGGCPTTTPTTTTTTAALCPEMVVDWKTSFRGPTDNGAACFNRVP